MCEDGGLFQFLGNFSDTVIAIELKAHVCLVQPHVLMYVSLVRSRQDSSFSCLFFSIFWGFLEGRLTEGLQISHIQPTYWDTCFDVWITRMRPGPKPSHMGLFGNHRSFEKESQSTPFLNFLHDFIYGSCRYDKWCRRR